MGHKIPAPHLLAREFFAPLPLGARKPCAGNAPHPGNNHRGHTGVNGTLLMTSGGRKQMRRSMAPYFFIFPLHYIPLQEKILFAFHQLICYKLIILVQYLFVVIKLRKSEPRNLCQS
jgi:hypothetical protein